MGQASIPTRRVLWASASTSNRSLSTPRATIEEKMSSFGRSDMYVNTLMHDPFHLPVTTTTVQKEVTDIYKYKEEKQNKRTLKRYLLEIIQRKK